MENLRKAMYKYYNDNGENPVLIRFSLKYYKEIISNLPELTKGISKLDKFCGIDAEVDYSQTEDYKLI